MVDLGPFVDLIHYLTGEKEASQPPELEAIPCRRVNGRFPPFPEDPCHLVVGSSNFALCPFHICGASVSMNSDALTLFKEDGREDKREGGKGRGDGECGGRRGAGGDEGEEEISLFTMSGKRDPCNSHGIIDLKHWKQRNTLSPYLVLIF